MKILNVVGARPNFVKIAPLMRAMNAAPDVTPVLVHTGQHYDNRMSDQLFEDLQIRRPDFNLGVGSGTHAAQTADVMKKLEPLLLDVAPDVVLVVGDVNSTLAAALTAVKLSITVAHVEAGLRSFDRSMPEEINRIVTDSVSDVLFVTEESGTTNLLREGVAPERIHMVGNVMIDALETCRPRWERSDIGRTLGLAPGERYGVVTLHRPSNVDDAAKLRQYIAALTDLSRELTLVFPIHPRVRGLLAAAGLDLNAGESRAGRIIVADPLGYLDFVSLVSRASLVLTDSGGVQEETTMLRVPCLTLRDNTERPVTVTSGTNRLIGADPLRIVPEALRALEVAVESHAVPPMWDGKAAERIVDILTAGTIGQTRAEAG